MGNWGRGVAKVRGASQGVPLHGECKEGISYWNVWTNKEG